MLIADNERTARRCCCCCYLDVKPGGSGDGRCRYRTTSNIFSDRRFKQYKQQIRERKCISAHSSSPLLPSLEVRKTDTQLAVTRPPNKNTSSMFYYYARTSCCNTHTHPSRRACHLLRGHGLYDYDIFRRSTQQISLDVEIFKTKFHLNR